MGIRDVVIFAVIFGGLPFILRTPAIGIMYWAWIGLMNPHRQAWGLAYAFPFAQVVAIATFIGLIFTKEPRQFKGGGAAWILLAFMVWTWVTTFFSLVPDDAWKMLDRVFKIQLFTLVSLFVLYKREHVLWLAATIVLSIGYYSVKGGIFTIATAGNYRVWGPAGSFVYDNNALALATVMSIPLWVYFQGRMSSKWIKWTIGACVILSAVSAIGSQSRGALLAISAMAGFLWIRSRRKVALGAVITCVAVALVAFMPSQWEDRMSTIATYEQDTSAMGRIEAWTMLFNLAVDRPFVGGGFEPYTEEFFARYNPAASEARTAHSIYFQVLGEQGFVGLGIFLSFWVATWRIGSGIIKRTHGKPEDEWANTLAQLVQVSLLGFLVGGAFLNLAYWDMPYYLMVLLAVTRHALQQNEKAGAGVARQPASPLSPGSSVGAHPR